MKPIRRFTARPWEIVAWPRLVPKDVNMADPDDHRAAKRAKGPVKLFPAYAA
jgi:hypothetical protein